MPFTPEQTAELMKGIETRFWSKRRPPLHLRDKVREGQRIKDKTIVLFFVRPAFERPGEFIEEPIAKVQHIQGVDDGRWRIFWQRAQRAMVALPAVSRSPIAGRRASGYRRGCVLLFLWVNAL